jgi:hypothetical protein
MVQESLQCSVFLEIQPFNIASTFQWRLATTFSWSRDWALVTIKMGCMKLRFTPCDCMLSSWSEEEDFRSTSRILDELEQQIPDTFAAVVFDFLRKSVKDMSSRSQRCVQDGGPYVEIWH